MLVVIGALRFTDHQPLHHFTVLERPPRSAPLLLLRLERVRGRTTRRCRRGAGLCRADHDVLAFLQIAGRDLRLLPVGDAELHEVRRERAFGVHGPESHHAAGLRARRTWATRCTVAARAAGESATEATTIAAGALAIG